MPHISGHIYLVTSEGGQYRLAILGRPTIKGSLYGVLSTLVVGHGSQLVPASCPIALLRLDEAMMPSYGHDRPGPPGLSGLPRGDRCSDPSRFRALSDLRSCRLRAISISALAAGISIPGGRPSTRRGSPSPSSSNISARG